MMWLKAYFYILNRLGVTRECDRRTDREIDILIANAALNYTARTKTQAKNRPRPMCHFLHDYITIVLSEMNGVEDS